MTQEYGTTNFEENKSSDAIKADIAQKRNEMGQKIDMLQERLDPNRLKEQMQESVQGAVSDTADAVAGYLRENVGDIAYSIADTIKRNPVPTALIGVGIGWLLMHETNSSAGRKQKNRSYGDSRFSKGGNGNYGGHEPKTYGLARSVPIEVQDKRYGAASQQAAGPIEQTSQQVKEKAGDVLNQAYDSAGQFVGQVQGLAQQAGAYAQTTIDQVEEQVGYAGEQVQQGFQSVGHQMQTTLGRNPVAFGVAALIGGVLIGLALPETETENQMLGNTRDQLLDNAQSAAKDLGQQAQHIVEEKIPAVKQTLQGAADTLKEAGKKVADDLKETGKSAAQDLRQTLQDTGESAKPDGQTTWQESKQRA